MLLLLRSEPRARPGLLSPAAGHRPAPLISRQHQQQLVVVLLVLGVFFRLFHFFNNRSFFIDELFLNVNIVKMSFWQLATQPFEYEQKAPLGYLWMSRWFVELLGRQEQALRLFSLLCGLGSLLLFVPVARFFVSGWGSVLAVGILALAYPAVYHSVEAKQYSTELFATVLALYFYIRFKDAHRVPALLSWGVLGGLLLWFSFPAIFVLAATGATVCFPALWHRNWPRLLRGLVPCTLWLLSFGVLYHFFVGKYHDSDWLTYFFQVKYDAYPPLRQVAALPRWVVSKAYAALSHPLGLLLEVDNSRTYYGFKHVLKMGWLSLALLLAGTWLLFRTDRRPFAVLVLPLALALVAAAAQQYPFYQRFTFFLLPMLILLLAYGAQQVSRRFARPWLAWALFGLVLLPSLANSARQVLEPDTFYNREYYRDVLLHVDDQYRPGDAVYVYWNMRQAYDYYKAAYQLRYPATKARYVKNSSRSQADYLRHLAPDFAAFRGQKRLWFVFDRNNRDAIGDYVDQPAWYHAKAFPPGRLLRAQFATLGKEVEVYRRGNYVAVLYDLEH